MGEFTDFQVDSAAPETEFFLATVTSWTNAGGVCFRLDGQEAATEKGYKMMLMCRPLDIGARVVVMKQSGTYVVLGEVAQPNGWKRIPDLSSAATNAQIIAKVNEIIAWMRTQGMLRT